MLMLMMSLLLSILMLIMIAMMEELILKVSGSYHNEKLRYDTLSMLMSMLMLMTLYARVMGQSLCKSRVFARYLVLVFFCFVFVLVVEK